MNFLQDTEGSSLWKKYRQSIHSCVDLLISKLSKSYDKSIQPNPDTTCGTGELWGRLVQRNSLEGILGGDDKRRMCVVIDDNMYYRSMRYSYFQLARKCKNWFRSYPTLMMNFNMNHGLAKRGLTLSQTSPDFYLSAVQVF